MRKSGRHIWAIWGNFGPFWVIFGPFWIILGHSRAMLDHLGPIGVIFEPLWGILGHFWPFLGHFVAYLDKFAESSNLFCGPVEVVGLAFRMYGPFSDIQPKILLLLLKKN